MVLRWVRPALQGPLLLGPLLLGLLLVGCGGDGEAPAPARDTVPKALPGTPPEVEAALLTADELGDGWKDDGATPFEERGLDGCPATDVLTSVEDPARLGEAQTYFLEGDEPPAPVFFTSVSLWESAEVARARLATFASAAGTCVDVPHRLPDGRRATYTIREAPAPDLGDEALGQEARFTVEDQPDGSMELIAVRLDDVVVLTLGERYDGSPRVSVSRARLEELTRKAVGKVQRRMPLS